MQGYLYVLANSSMPDLVKVGKTNRQPSLRAQELSRVTGVPTPFIVVYERFVEDSDAAEEFVHVLLEQKGYRLSPNREFFSAPVTEVISAILSLPSDQQSVNSNDAGLSTAEELDQFESLQLPGAEPWRNLWDEGQKHQFGLGDYLVDPQEAVRLYKDAAKLGCIFAYMRLGDAYQYGVGATKNLQRALEYYKEGAKKGNYACTLAMANLFGSQGQRENTLKCVRLFLRDRATNWNQEIEDTGTVLSNSACFIAYCTEAFLALPVELQKQFVPDKSWMLVSLAEVLEGARNIEGHQAVVPLIENAQDIVSLM